MIEDQFEVPFVAALALREKQIQQNYRPIIAVHKWFARRPGTVFRGLLLAEFGEGPISDTYFQSHQFPHTRIADPFMGGGTPLIEANRLGMDVLGYDINPMAYWIVQQELAQIDRTAYLHEARRLMTSLQQDVGPYYETTCVHCGDSVPAKYFLWVKTQPCHACQQSIDLFPGYLLAEDVRHPRNVLVCAACGQLNEVDDLHHPGVCLDCDTRLQVKGPAQRGVITCPHCGVKIRYPSNPPSTPEHRLFALEYFCPSCRVTRTGRFFKRPDSEDLHRVKKVRDLWAQTSGQFVPDDSIPGGDETNRLHRWGYRHYSDLFNARQLLGLERSAQWIAKVPEVAIRNALATNLSDLLRYQNMLCRYDTMALKSLDVFSLHGFPVGLIQVESNVIGIEDPRKHVPIGSGGWLNIVEKYHKAKAYCDDPFEIQRADNRKRVVLTPGEWIGELRAEDHREIRLHCADAAQAVVRPQSLDAVFTDPPYFDNVQYAELMDLCYVWLRRLAVDAEGALTSLSTRNGAELTGNVTLARGLNHFTEGLSQVFQRMATGLKPGRPFVFTYHHNTVEAYVPVAVAILDARLTCTKTLPVPGEMSASIHIKGTNSSIIDTVFVCRAVSVPKAASLPVMTAFAHAVTRDIEALKAGGVPVTLGDRRCVIYGHLVEAAIRYLRPKWNPELPVSTKRALVMAVLQRLPTWNDIDHRIAENSSESTADPFVAEVP